ncbi:MAG: hypothetical protein CMJ90_09410 [Planctomycetes bacterium]|nr:hypothetical protein [Planctomycetota bacterium]
MIIVFVLQPLLVVAWLAAEVVFGQGGDFLYGAVMVSSALTVLLLAVLGRLAVHWTIVAVVLALVPPLAPIVVCHVCTHVLLRATYGRADDDPWEVVSQHMARRWLRAGNLASMMCVVLLYYWWDAVDRARLTLAEAVFVSPLRLMSDAFAPFVKLAFFAVTIWYGAQLIRTGRIVLALRRGAGAGADGASGSDDAP